MPRYLDTSGRTVDAAVATYPNGLCKPGFSEVVADGEHVRFGLMQRDSAIGGSVFLTDTNTTDEDVARAKYEHAQAMRSQRVRDAWRTPAGGSPPPAPQRTADAEADFSNVQARLSEERRNAWKGGR